MIGQPNPDKPVLARREVRFAGELKMFDRYKIAKISQYNSLPQNVVDPPLEDTKKSIRA
jgi:hypothetical protein